MDEAVEVERLVHAHRLAPVEPRRHHRARIERHVEHRLDLPRPAPRIAARRPPQPPEGRPERRLGRRRQLGHRAVRAEAERHLRGRAVAPQRVVEHRRPALGRIPPPAPAPEIGLERAAAEIAVEIAVAPPAPAREAEIDLDLGHRREGPPDMGFLERYLHPRHRARMHPHRAADPAQMRHRDLVEPHDEAAARPFQRRRPDGEAPSPIASPRLRRARSSPRSCRARRGRH
jgi:hypothetical protein